MLSRLLLMLLSHVYGGEEMMMMGRATGTEFKSPAHTHMKSLHSCSHCSKATRSGSRKRKDSVTLEGEGVGRGQCSRGGR